MADQLSDQLKRVVIYAKGDTSSPNQITVAGDTNQVPSYTKIVESIDDLLIEILIRLPLIALLLFKCVSKRWSLLIRNISFRNIMSQRCNVDPPCGLIICGMSSNPSKRVFVPFDTRITPNMFPFRLNLTFGSQPYRVLHSCNGLQLCCTQDDSYYIYNPFVDEFKNFPLPRIYGFVDTGRLVFDPAKSPNHYKVVCAGPVINDYYNSIQIYSSETGDWSGRFFRCVHFPPQRFLYFRNGVYWNGSIHWFDPANMASHFKLDLDPPVVSSIKSPIESRWSVDYTRKLFISGGYLLLASIVYEDYRTSRKMNIYEMSKGCSIWSMKYCVNLDEIVKLAPKTLKMPVRWACSKVWCIIMGEREEDSFIVIELFGKIIQYKIVKKTLRELYDMKYMVIAPTIRYHEFIASLAQV